MDERVRGGVDIRWISTRKCDFRPWRSDPLNDGNIWEWFMWTLNVFNLCMKLGQSLKKWRVVSRRWPQLPTNRLTANTHPMKMSVLCSVACNEANAQQQVCNLCLEAAVCEFLGVNRPLAVPRSPFHVSAASLKFVGTEMCSEDPCIAGVSSFGLVCEPNSGLQR